MKKRTTSGSYFPSTSRMVKKLPSDFDIFSSSTPRIMPWVHEALERLARLDEAEVAQRLREEAGVEQVEDGVLDAADVLVDRHPPRARRHIPRRVAGAQRLAAHVVGRHIGHTGTTTST